MDVRHYSSYKINKTTVLQFLDSYVEVLQIIYQVESSVQLDFSYFQTGPVISLDAMLCYGNKQIVSFCVIS